MRFAVTFATLVVVATIATVAESKDRNNKAHKVVCYYESWTEKFHPEDIDLTACTHINFSFAELKNNEIALMNGASDEKLIQRMDALRKKNAHVSALISLGGWSEGSTKYSEMVRDANHRKHFVQQAVSFLQKYDLDGLDIDWEYPAFTGVADGNRELGRAQDKQDYIELLKELKTAFAPHNFLLTAAVASGKYQIDHSYDVPSMSKYLDFLNFMTYDFHGDWEKKAGYNAPLYPPAKADEETKELTVQYAVDYLIKLGMEPKKIILGIPLYGHSYRLANSANNSVGAPTKSAGSVGGSYNEICRLLKKSGWKQHWDNSAQVPYAVNGDQWLNYENEKSVQLKVEFALQRKLGGAMVWAVDLDDYKGDCGVKYPLMRVIHQTLHQ